METDIILQHILPIELAENFDLTEVKVEGLNLILTLDEKNIIPKEHRGKPLESKGFHAPVSILDFPIRGKPVKLLIRRRKWRDKQTGEVYTRKWELTAKGTSYSKEFAAFLKGMVG
jgi:hypothetical protein